MKTVSSSLLSPYSATVTAAFTTRHGGVSKAPYTTANLAFHVGDNADDVLANHDLLARMLGYECCKLVHMRQIHSDRIVIADESHRFDTLPECDALLTDIPDIPLMVMSADCTPILLYDPVNNAIGAVHAGRAGALNEILPKTVQKMKQLYGSNNANIHIILGPSIHGCCYEINSAIAEEVQEKSYESALRTEGKRIFLDVNTILRTQMDALKIDPEHIEILEHCTSCRSDTYFSYRANQQRTGRIAGVIMLR